MVSGQRSTLNEEVITQTNTDFAELDKSKKLENCKSKCSDLNSDYVKK